MEEIKMGEDRPRNVFYKDGDYQVSLVFSWAEPGVVPSGVKVHVAESAKPDNFSQSSQPLPKNWEDVEGAEEEGRKFASGLIATWHQNRR
ncbi:hypothetical protein Q7O56_25115 [Pseudomonas protegens]|uniref:hypothetical protein n=1 Tax=Pseudomonas protegens TaxID=380021 RepID=UPI0027460BDD|nr:hypothetical protein [Pseudomonas protegens]MDP9512314.1 hypothetical protein [Pseudomonas protegens]